MHAHNACDSTWSSLVLCLDDVTDLSQLIAHESTIIKTWNKLKSVIKKRAAALRVRTIESPSVYMDRPMWASMKVWWTALNKCRHINGDERPNALHTCMVGDVH